MSKLVKIAILIISFSVYAEPRVRPDTWGDPIIGTNFENLYVIDKGIYRSEQPEEDDIKDLELLGIKEILNLREFHSDKGEMRESEFILNRVKMNAGEVTQAQILDSLKIIKNRKGPILIHCWHGSDRTGATIAAYRIIFNDWTKSQALDEMINGGYGYHAKIYPNLVDLINRLNITEIREALDMEVK